MFIYLNIAVCLVKKKCNDYNCIFHCLNCQVEFVEFARQNLRFLNNGTTLMFSKPTPDFEYMSRNFKGHRIDYGKN